ncbi:pyridoxal phosphate-dependent aminotransferase, partial [Streptomyces sp. B1866]|nr:pyridoxal phosphate-dependent aminotransferase [Streptomyces sp. B1866]
ARVAAACRAQGAVAGAAHRALAAAGALVRPPRVGRHLYADLEELRDALAARGIADSVELEGHLTRRLGVPVPGGHHFGDGPDDLRVRLSVLPLLGASDEARRLALAAADPLALPHVAHALADLAAAFEELTAG